MRRPTWSTRRFLLAAAAPFAAFAFAGTLRGDGDVTVALCDGESAMAVPGLRPGQVLPREEAEKVAGQMMRIWRMSQGEARWAAWAAEEAVARSSAPAAPSAAAAEEPGQPVKFTARDQMLWKREEKKWIDEGYKAFHSWQSLGGTIGISCDMCHPDASNTHPETYPKFQTQTKKVALLRDMINWCIENPMKGKPLPEGDARLRAVEAYILASRKGVPLEPGKH
jgi:thiosulfate dehydrogenase